MVNPVKRDGSKLRVRFNDNTRTSIASGIAALHCIKPLHPQTRHTAYVAARRIPTLKTKKAIASEGSSKESSPRKGGDSDALEHSLERVMVPRVIFSSNNTMVSSIETTTYQDYLKNTGRFQKTAEVSTVTPKLNIFCNLYFAEQKKDEEQNTPLVVEE